jgi:hypothetical protein
MLMDNRYALIVDYRVTQEQGTGARDTAKAMEADRPDAHRQTIDADTNHDNKGCVAEMRRIRVTPHVKQNTARSGGSAIFSRSIRQKSYATSINARRDIEYVVGWIKNCGGLRQFKLRDTCKVIALCDLDGIAYNRIRLSNLFEPVVDQRYAQPPEIKERECSKTAAFRRSVLR